MSHLLPEEALLTDAVSFLKNQNWGDYNTYEYLLSVISKIADPQKRLRTYDLLARTPEKGNFADV